MSTRYRFVYFNMRARGEPIRWIFDYAGQEFEDHRVELANWAAIKPTTPMGTLPYLEVDGKHLSGSMPVARYLARNFGLGGQNAWEEAAADAIADYVEDANKGWVTWVKALMGKDERPAESLKEEYLAAGVVPYLQGLERMLRQNGHNTGFVVGPGVTWVHIVMVTFLDQMVHWEENVLDNYPLLRMHSDRIHSLKGVREWLTARPDSGIL